MPLVPEYRYAADAHGHRPRGAHQHSSHQLRHVPAVMERVHDRYVPVTHEQRI